MKGILLFDNQNDLCFFDVDDDLMNHINKLAIKDGLVEHSLFGEDKIDCNVIVQLFSPLIASYNVMHGQFGNKYKYIESEDGVILVFDEILNYIAISICYKDEKLMDIQQELSLFLIVIQMLYGSALHMIKDDISLSAKCKMNRSHLVSIIVKKWMILRMEQQMYLVEAVERILINQDITAMCVTLLQEILEKTRRLLKDGTYTHAFALVDTKLLALCSSRNSGQLSKETLLLLILFVQVLKGSTSQAEDKGTDDDDEFFIPVSTSTATHMKDKHKGSSNKGSPLEEEEGGTFHSLLIYIKSQSGCLVPHILYDIEVTRRISIVILNELTPYATFSSSVFSLLKQMNNLQRHPVTRKPHGPFDDLESQYKSLVDVVWKMEELENKERHLMKLLGKWQQLKESELETFFQMPREKTTDARLESALSSCCELLKSLCEEGISVPCLELERATQGTDYHDILRLLQKLSLRHLKDVADFLEVKAEQNISMASYLPEYEGLLHFLYVDRSSDCLIAPTVILRRGHLNGTTSLKQKIWKMVATGRKYIDGVKKFCCLWKDDDLAYFYNVWFEDSMGRVIKPTAHPNLKTFPRKGIICGNFFKKLVRECFPGASYDHICCYEFFSVHLESTPTETIVEHSRKLCTQLWDFTGAYRSSLELL